MASPNGVARPIFLCYHAGMPLPAKLSLIPDFDSKGMSAYLSEQADVIAVYLFGSQNEAPPWQVAGVGPVVEG
ncbi:MAG: hypothetical protein GY759_15805 [Chloroflexi bacterium]|nr:hypothetical protein [Chloroflexota bacterium]